MNEMEVMFGVRTLAKGKRWRESKKEGASECCLGASCDWPVYRGGAAKGRFSLAVHGCSSFGRTRNGTGACPASDLTCRRDDGTPSFLSLLGLVLIRVFFVAGWCLCPVVHAVWGQTASHDPNGPNRDPSHPHHVLPVTFPWQLRRGKKPSTSALHLSPAEMAAGSEDLVMRGPDRSGPSPRPTSCHLKHAEEQTFSLLILTRRCRRAGPTGYAAPDHTMTHVGDNGGQTRQTIDDRRRRQTRATQC